MNNFNNRVTKIKLIKDINKEIVQWNNTKLRNNYLNSNNIIIVILRKQINKKWY